MNRLRGLATWQVAGPLGVYAIVALLVVLYLGLFVALHDSQQSLATARQGATRRIDMLQHEMGLLQNRLRGSQVHDARERGRLEEAIKALAEQIRQLGGHPVADVRTAPSPPPSQTPTRHHPSPSPTTHHPRPTPTPTPTPTTCDLTHPLRCLAGTP